ncbi:hypothetical protein AB0D04_30560 [Streptomyces sp. NPDC048483]|uniref:hypothetical protein n=1 Tax=Streptomyces sp. NPDC048483 TaxID=3154927 RepID=UPI0034419A4A
MTPSRAALATTAALLTALTAGSAGTALADDNSGELSVTSATDNTGKSSSFHPGEEVEVTALPGLVAMSKDGNLTAESPAFSHPAKLTTTKNTSVGKVKIRCDTKPCTYKAKITGHDDDPSMKAGDGTTTIEVTAGTGKNCNDADDYDDGSELHITSTTHKMSKGDTYRKPSPFAPGENIDVTALPELSAISKNGTLTAQSPAFAQPLKLTRDKKQSTGQAQVRCDAKPGAYKIRITGHPNDPVMDAGAGRTTIEVKAGPTKNCADHSNNQAQAAKDDKGSNTALIVLSAGGAAILAGAGFAISRRRRNTTG